jgi:hypothetical protein
LPASLPRTRLYVVYSASRVLLCSIASMSKEDRALKTRMRIKEGGIQKKDVRGWVHATHGERCVTVFARSHPLAPLQLSPTATCRGAPIARLLYANPRAQRVYLRTSIRLHLCPSRLTLDPRRLYTARLRRIVHPPSRRHSIARRCSTTARKQSQFGEGKGKEGKGSTYPYTV